MPSLHDLKNTMSPDGILIFFGQGKQAESLKVVLLCKIMAEIHGDVHASKEKCDLYLASHDSTLTFTNIKT